MSQHEFPLITSVQLSRPASRSDPIGGSEPVSGCETICLGLFTFFFFLTFTLPYAYNEAYSYVTSNSSHNTHVGFYPFQVPYHYHDRITSMCHVFYKFQFISSTCMICQIIFKTNLYIYNGKSKHIKVISNAYRVNSD